MRLLTATLVLAFATNAFGSPVFLGPTPYLSEADSPFDLGTFFLEDFEDGELNTPGIFQSLHPATHAEVVAPGPFTDSVDGDSGSIDGDGTSGRSLGSRAFLFRLTDPIITTWFIRFAFDKNELGYLPNAFGFVWTDGIQDSIVKIELFDEEFNIFATHEYSELFGDEVFTGTTADDRFLGVVSDQEIFWVQITSRQVGDRPTLEIDHVQYGLVIPEPSGRAMFTLTFLGFFVAYRSAVKTRGFS